MTNYTAPTIIDMQRINPPMGNPFYFGDELVMNLYDVDRDTIRDEELLRNYARQLVDILDMKAYGPPVLEHFGHDSPVTSGYTLVQLIETSSITAHFSEHKSSAYINIFSCRKYDVTAALHFTISYFSAQRCHFWKMSR